MREALVPHDPVKLVRTWLSGKYPWQVNVTKNRPNPLGGRVVTIRRTGAATPDMVTDAAWLTVECFAADDDAAAELGHLTFGLLRAMKDELIDETICYQVDTLGGPNDFPLTDPGELQKPRYVMSVQAHFRAAQVDLLTSS